MKDKIISYLFIIFIFAFMIISFIMKDTDISYSERRKLKQISDVTFPDNFVSQMEKYMLDQFPFRDEFRSIKASVNYNLLKQKENNDILLKDNYIFKNEYPTNNQSISYFNNKIKSLSNLFPNSNKYLMIIPDKNFFLEDNLSIDYKYLYNETNSLNLNNIDITNIMELNDYYETDTHWKQQNLLKVINKMSKTMNFNYQNYNYQENKFDKFYGVYYGQSALKRDPENITYLTNDSINNARVSYLENKNLHTVYNTNKLASMDAYEVYLDGASSFIEINNSNCDIDKELIVFRDSFGSSLVPLLIPYYGKITVIDNRYIDSKNFLKNLEITNQDVLFMYSTLIVNNSFTLKG